MLMCDKMAVKFDDEDHVERTLNIGDRAFYSSSLYRHINYCVPYESIRLIGCSYYL